MNYRRRIVASEVWKIIVTSLIYFCNITKCSLPCELSYGGCNNQQTRQHQYVDSYFAQPMVYYNKHTPPVFVPSPPGKIPQCARPGLTFCEKIDRYPVDLIATLAAKTNYNFKTLFASGGMTGNKKAESHRASNEHGHYPLPSGQVHATYRTLNNFNQSSQQEGYPDRRYPFDESSAHLVDPGLYASFGESARSSYDPNEWWKRSERSDNSQTGNKRKRRQIPPAGIELCPTRSQFIMPRAALNSRGEWKYVVNVEQGSEKYTQLVRSEVCVSETCNGICSLPNGYTSRCEQKYVMKRLVALEGTGSHLYTDIFWFPHCCVCQIQPDIR